MRPRPIGRWVRHSLNRSRPDPENARNVAGLLKIRCLVTNPNTTLASILWGVGNLGVQEPSKHPESIDDCQEGTRQGRIECSNHLMESLRLCRGDRGFSEVGIYSLMALVAGRVIN